MKVLKIELGSTFIEEWTDVFVSQMPLAYLQGIRDAEGKDAILIGSNGSEIQLKKVRLRFTHTINRQKKH